MIATCPACGKRYRLADDAVPVAGRNVRCAACGNGWTVLPEGDLGSGGADGGTVDAAGVAPIAAPATTDTAAPAVPTPAAHEATPVPAAVPAHSPPPSPPPAPLPSPSDHDPARARPRRRHIGWLAAVFALLAVAVLAVVEFAPERTFDPPRLGLPPPRLPLADLGSLRLPSLHAPTLDLPPLDLTRVPLVGDTLDRLVNPPRSPLHVTGSGVRHHLANGTWVMTVAGTVTNPTAAPVALAGIDAALLDGGGHVAYRWRIAAPASVIGAHGSAVFDTTAANFPPEATRLRLAAR